MFCGCVPAVVGGTDIVRRSMEGFANARMQDYVPGGRGWHRLLADPERPGGALFCWLYVTQLVPAALKRQEQAARKDVVMTSFAVDDLDAALVCKQAYDFLRSRCIVLSGFRDS